LTYAKKYGIIKYEQKVVHCESDYKLKIANKS
jgi:hypothetical protein